MRSGSHNYSLHMNMVDACLLWLVDAYMVTALVGCSCLLMLLLSVFYSDIKFTTTLLAGYVGMLSIIFFSPAEDFNAKVDRGFLHE